MKEKDREHFFMQAETNMKELTQRMLKVVMEFMLHQMEIDMKVNGIMIRDLVMVPYIWLMVINILENGKMVKNQEKEYIISNMETLMMVHII
jgi:hypothetical protein